MESILVRPRDGRELARFRRFFEESNADVEYAPQRVETLEARIARLYAEGHYGEDELRQFLSIPREHRVDPFEVIDDGDVYYADRRNVDYVNENIEQAHRDRAEGRCVKKRPGEGFGDFLERITADEPV